MNHQMLTLLSGRAACVHANERKVPNDPVLLRREFLLASARQRTNKTNSIRHTPTRRMLAAPALHIVQLPTTQIPKTDTQCACFFFQVPAARCSALQLYYPLRVVHYAGAGTSSSLPLPIVNPLVPSGPLGMRRRGPSPSGAPGALGVDLEFTNLGGCALLPGLAAAQPA